MKNWKSRSIFITFLLITITAGVFVWWNYDASANVPLPTPAPTPVPATPTIAPTATPDSCVNLGEMQLLGADGAVPVFMPNVDGTALIEINELKTGTLVTVQRCVIFNGEQLALIVDTETAVTGWVGYSSLVPVTGRPHPFVSVDFAGGTAEGATEVWSTFVSADAEVIWMRVDASNLTTADVFQYRIIAPDGQDSFGNRYTQGELGDGSVLIALPLADIRDSGAEGTWKVVFIVNNQAAGTVGFRVR